MTLHRLATICANNALTATIHNNRATLRTRRGVFVVTVCLMTGEII